MIRAPALLLGLFALGTTGRAATTVDADATFSQAVLAEQARPAAPRFPRAAFLLRQAASSVALSPDGRRLAWIRIVGGARSVWMQSTIEGGARSVLSHTEARSLAWSQDSRWLLLSAPDQLFALAADGQAGSGAIAALGGAAEVEFLGADPARAAAALLRDHLPAAAGRDARWRLLRADVHGRLETLHTDTRQITAAAFDRAGRLAYLQRLEGAALVLHRVDRHASLHELLRCQALQRCSLLARVDADGNPWLRTDSGGDLQRLVRIDPDGSLRTLSQDPRAEADLDALTVDPLDGRPRVAAYRGTTSIAIALDDAAGAALAEIQARYPDRRLDLQVGRGEHARWLIAEQDSALQGVRWHLYDPRSHRFRDILDDAPWTERDQRPAAWLPAAAMARKRPFAWTASDGRRLHGFVWLPPGRDASTLPLLALVHGGPWSGTQADEFGAGYSQFLANRGVIVFEPNFRGSTGYGRDYMLAARGDFGNGRVQQDIVEGVRALLAARIGAADRVGIAGASFGGYAALLGVTWQPQLFKLGMALVPPPDFAWDLAWVARSREADALSRYAPFKDWLRALALDLDDTAAMGALHAQAPLAHAGRMDRPLLMLAGGQDHRVAIRGVLDYAARLKLQGKDVTLLVDDGAGHSNDDPLAHEATLYLFERMLQAHLGLVAPTPPDAVLRDYLQRHLRLRGRAMQPL